MSEALSDCCGAPPWGETDLCAECKEHADFLDDEEFADLQTCPVCHGKLESPHRTTMICMCCDGKGKIKRR